MSVKLRNELRMKIWDVEQEIQSQLNAPSTEKNFDRIEQLNRESAAYIRDIQHLLNKERA